MVLIRPLVTICTDNTPDTDPLFQPQRVANVIVASLTTGGLMTPRNVIFILDAGEAAVEVIGDRDQESSDTPPRHTHSPLVDSLAVTEA